MKFETRDEITVDRTWRSGVEMISRMNWSQLARVRGALEVGVIHFARNPLPSVRASLMVVAGGASQGSGRRKVA